MAGTLKLRVVSPEKVLLEEDVHSIRFPGEDGLFGVLPRHAAMLSLTESGLLTARTARGESIELIIHDGFAEVRDDVVTVLTRSAEHPAEVDLERAEAAAQRARERLRVGLSKTEFDMARAQAALRRALARRRESRNR